MKPDMPTPVAPVQARAFTCGCQIAVTTAGYDQLWCVEHSREIRESAKWANVTWTWAGDKKEQQP